MSRHKTVIITQNRMGMAAVAAVFILPALSLKVPLNGILKMFYQALLSLFFRRMFIEFLRINVFYFFRQVSSLFGGR